MDKDTPADFTAFPRAYASTMRWVTGTYLIYCVALLAIALGGTGYAVCVLDASGWWFVLAVGICSASYKPHDWRGLLTGRRRDGSHG